MGLTVGETFLVYLFLFLFGAMLGYAIEVLFRRIFTAKRWVNPGFLKGPWLPLYGFGMILMFTISWILYAFLPFGNSFYNPFGDLFGITGSRNGPNVYDLLPIFLSGTSLLLLEILAGLIFVKGFHVKLWDYSNLKGNIGGITAPLFDLVWYYAAVVYFYGINPFVYQLVLKVGSFFFGSGGADAHFVWLFFFGVVYGIFLIDVISSLKVFGKIRAWAKDNGLVVLYDKTRDSMKDKLGMKKKLFRKLSPTLFDKSFAEKAKAYKEKAVDSSKAFKRKIRSFFLINPDYSYQADKNFGSDNRPVSTAPGKEEAGTEKKEEKKNG